MELWTEYEGRTIDGLFPLTKLLRPEGRSAFFLTSNGNGIPRVIRLIEPHFDEDEILARWRGVAALNHPNILKLEKFGQVELEDGSFLYAVMEPVDANLGDVLTQQRLTLPDARQLAESLISAIDTLHAHGFIHEHIEPDHIYAIGETVKLRCDCIREAPEGEEGVESKRRDVHDFSVVLLQALTQQTTLEAAARDLPLSAPFDRLVRNGISGDWDSAQLAAALKTAPSETRVSSQPTVTAPEVTPPPVTASTEPAKMEPPPSFNRLPRISAPVEDEEPGDARGIKFSNPKSLAAIGLAVVLLLWLVWHFLSGRPADQNHPQPAASAPAPAAESSAAAPAPAQPAPPAPSHSPVDARNQWHVIAYTYNHQDQAQHKADTVARMHPDLHPEVFSPTGRAPYLVAIGGAMSRDEAFALAQKARNEGLPRDTYAQNYTGRSR